MSNVPHDTVFGSVVDIVQGDGQLYYAEARGEVSGIDGELLDNGLAELVANLRQLVDAQLSQVGGIVYVVEYLYFLLFHLRFFSLSGDKGTTIFAFGKAKAELFYQ